MSWTRTTSKTEKLMVDILSIDNNCSLTLNEIVEKILSIYPGSFSGKTPEKSLYSVLYRRENKRKELGLPFLFKTTRRGGSTYYSLNESGMENVGERIKVK